MQGAICKRMLCLVGSLFACLLLMQLTTPQRPTCVGEGDTRTHSHHPESVSFPPFSSPTRMKYARNCAGGHSFVSFYLSPAWFSRRSGRVCHQRALGECYKSSGEPSPPPLSVLSGPMGAVSRILERSQI